MFHSIVGIIFAVAVVNASFHHKFHHHFNKHFTYDVNGFKGHHNEQGMYNVPFPPPPQFGPFPHNHHHYHHHHHHDHHPEYHHNHGPQCHQNHGNGFPDMVPFNPFVGPNMPFNPMNPFNVPNFNPYQSNGQIPNQSIPPNQPFDPTSTFKMNTPLAPFDTNTVFTNPSNGQNPVPNTPNNFDPFNVNIQPQNGATEATTDLKSNQNNDNNYGGIGTNAFDNNNNKNSNNNNNVNTNDQTTVPSVNRPELTTASNQGKNGLDYDIDIRFGGPNDNKTNQKSSN